MHMLDFSTKVDFDGERFRYFMFLVGIQCVINAIFAKSGKRNNEVTGHCSQLLYKQRFSADNLTVR